MNGEEIKKGKPLYILAVRGKNKNGGDMMVRLGTHSFDHLRNNLKRFSNDDIFYVAKRWGRRMKDIKAVPVYSRRMGKLVCDKDAALKRLSMMV